MYLVGGAVEEQQDPPSFLQHAFFRRSAELSLKPELLVQSTLI